MTMFLDLIWWVLLAFVFVAYFMLLFSIISDLFNDHKLSGWAKAGWVILLIVTWWLGVLIYVIARGNGMAKRQAAAVAEFKKEQDDYIRDVAGQSHADEIAKADKLKKSGALTDAEYTALKKKILAS